jgi:hypothetical protein
MPRNCQCPACGLASEDDDQLCDDCVDEINRRGNL